MSTKILVTGGAGYIGSILVPALLHEGHMVTVIDNFLYGQSSLLDVCADKNLKIVRDDARNEKVIRTHIKNADIIVPLACLVGMPLCETKPIEARTTNLGAIKLILGLRKKNQKIIFPTTNSGYGIGEKGKYCTEKTPLRPVSLYGKLKVEAEREILKKGNAITLRLATVFGVAPRMRRDLLVNDFVYRAVNDRFVVLFQADFKRNYIHIRDVARAFLHCINNFENMNGEAYNVGLSDANLNKRELCDVIKKEIPGFYFTEAKVGEDSDKRDYIVSNAKIEKAGFMPAYTLVDGIRELIKGYHVIKENKFSNI